MSKYPGRIVTDLAPAGYSVYFDGNGDFLSAASNAAFAFGTGDFTIEAWINPSSLALDTLLCGTDATSGAILGYSTTTVWLGSRSASYDLTATYTIPLNTWTHIAVSRQGTTARLFANGVQIASGTVTNNYAQGPFAIGNYTVTNIGVNGYLSNVRVVKGTALYTAAFTPPTQLFNVTNTSILACNSPAFVDQSSNAFTLTAAGTPSVSTFTPFRAYVPYNPALGASTPGIWTVDEAMQAAATRQWNMYDPNFQNTTLLLHGNPPANVPTLITDASSGNVTITSSGSPVASSQSPFSLTSFPTSGSGYFPTTADFFNASLGAGQAFGTGDFTVECWLYTGVSACNIMQPSSGTNTWGFLTFSNQFYWQFNGGNVFGAGTVPSNTWTHLAVSRVSGTLSGYVNGTRVYNAADSNNYSGTPTRYIGPSGGGSVPFFVSNARVVKGTGLYSGATITVPTSPLTAVTNTALLTLQNSQSANNNAFLDSSSNNLLITRNGNTTQGSFSPFSQTGWSNYFLNANSQYIYAVTGANTAPGTGAFCAELWYYKTDTNTAGLIGNLENNTDAQWSLAIVSGVIRIQGWNTVFLTATEPSLNQWHHVAVCRSGTTMSMFVDGIRVATGTVSNNFSGTTDFRVGVSVGIGFFNGYISNVRFVKGSSVYDPNLLNITVPTTPLTNIANTTFLTCQSNRFVDNGTANGGSGYTILPVSSPSVQAFSPFYPTAAYTPQTIGGSGYFDGTGDYLISASNAALALGSSDFCIEWWENRNVVNPDDTPVSTGPYASFSSCLLGYSGTVGAVGTSGGSGFNVFNFPAYIDTLNPKSWTHFVYTRSGTAFRVFMNGKLSNYATGSGNILQNNNQFCVGGNPGGDQYSVPGYITNFRVVIGSIPTGYQTSSTTPGTIVFTPPTTPPTTTSQGATANDVKLLLNMTNVGVVDSTGKNALETVGDARISTALSVFGGSSMSFNGTNSTLLLRNSQLMNLGSSDFTLEFWMYRSAATASQPFYSLSGSSQTNSLALDMNASGGLLAYATASGGGTWGLLGGVSFGTVPLTTWTHVALVRNGSTWRGYLNGVVGFTVTNSSAIASFDGVSIGSSGASTLWFNGFIDDFRITRFARYTGNFTPQTSQWQDQ